MLPAAPPLPQLFCKQKESKVRSTRRFEHADYGQPPKGSRTEERGLAAQAHIQQEVRFLCETIKTIGTEIENESMTIYEITFKQLFDFYTNISNKLVGILLRARKHGYVYFPEQYEVLFQNKHDDVKIQLIRMPSD